MNYSPAIITPPIKWGQDYECDLQALGDSIFITPLTTMDTTLKFHEPLPPMVTTKPCVMLVEKHKGVIDSITEGEDLNITVRLSEAAEADIAVDLVVNHNGMSDVDNSWRESKDVQNAVDNMDYVSEFFSPTVDTDFATLTTQIVIPQGDTEASITLATVDDTLLTGGKGHYRIGTIEIVSQDNSDYMIHHQKNKGLVFLEDSSTMPKFSGKLEVWCRMSKLGEYEPVDDPELGGTVEMVYDWNMSEDGLTVESWAGRSKIIDDVPIETLLFKFLPDEIPMDMNQTDPADFTTISPFIRFQVICGRRK